MLLYVVDGILIEKELLYRIGYIHGQDNYTIINRQTKFYRENRKRKEHSEQHKNININVVILTLKHFFLLRYYLFGGY